MIKVEKHVRVNEDTVLVTLTVQNRLFDYFRFTLMCSRRLDQFSSQRQAHVMFLETTHGPVALYSDVGCAFELQIFAADEEEQFSYLINALIVDALGIKTTKNSWN